MAFLNIDTYLGRRNGGAEGSTASSLLQGPRVDRELGLPSVFQVFPCLTSFHVLWFLPTSRKHASSLYLLISHSVVPWCG